MSQHPRTSASPQTQQQPNVVKDDDQNQAIISTADDAILAKLSCVEKGYYDDPFIRAMARGASSSSGLMKSSTHTTTNSTPLRHSFPIDNDHVQYSSPGKLRLDRQCPFPCGNNAIGMGDHFYRGGQEHARMRGFPPHPTTMHAPPSSTEPIIRRGTHARVAAIDRAIRAFLSLPLPSNANNDEGDRAIASTEDSSCRGGTNTRKVARQVVILGAGRDTTYLRHRFESGRISAASNTPGKAANGTHSNSNVHIEATLNNHDPNGSTADKLKEDMVEEFVQWYEVDHPSVIQQKAKSLLPGCIPQGYNYQCTQVVGNRNCSSSTSQAPTSYAISLTKHNNGIGIDSSIKQSDCTKESSTSNYHLIGHDLRSAPSDIFEILAHPQHGYNRTIPTLFVLECVMMYLPDESSWDLLRYLANTVPASISPSTNSATDPFVAVVLYDPIPCNDRFGQVMLQNLQKRGIAGRRSHLNARNDDHHTKNNDNGEHDVNDISTRSLLSLEKTRNLDDQLSKLTQSGFDVAVGCHMMDAYDHGVISMEERRRAARCEMLDELEEFVLLMRHYCLVVGVRAGKSDDSDGIVGTGNDGRAISKQHAGFQLCAVGKKSPIGFQEGRCSVAYR